MEQKTEASQAVDERAEMIAALSMCAAALAQGSSKRSRDIACEYACEALRRAALKAQPAPTEAPKIVCTYPSSRHLPPCDECVAAGGCIQAGSKGVAKAPTEAQVDGLSPVYAWLERSTRNSPAEVANAARTMMAFYQGAEFPEAAQGEDSARLDGACDCDSPSWCKNYNRCHRQVCGFPLRGTTPKPV